VDALTKCNLLLGKPTSQSAEAFIFNFLMFNKCQLLTEAVNLFVRFAVRQQGKL